MAESMNTPTNQAIAPMPGLRKLSNKSGSLSLPTTYSLHQPKSLAAMAEAVELPLDVALAALEQASPTISQPSGPESNWRAASRFVSAAQPKQSVHNQPCELISLPRFFEAVLPFSKSFGIGTS